MGMFAYRAIGADGRVSSGRMPALSAAELEGRLRNAGMELLKARPVRAGRLLGGSGVPRRELINFCFHLEQTLGAGLMVTDSLQDLVDGLSHAGFRETLVVVLQAVRDGSSLSAALSAFPDIFDDVFIGLVRSGEASGRQAEVFGKLAANLRWQDELSAQVTKLLMYPLFTTLVLAGVVLFVLLYLVPQLSGFIKSMSGGELPFQTALLLAASEGLVAHWPKLLAVPPVLAVGAWLTLRLGGEPMRFRLDGLKFKLPLFGPILRKIALSRFASLFGMLYEAGVPILDAIQVGREAAGNRVLAHGIGLAKERIEQGVSVSDAFAEANLFPSLMIRMLRIGESTGGIDTALRNAAYFYNREVQESIGKVQGMIEPMLTVAMGGVLGWLMMAVLGPMYDLLAKIKF
jgi:type IV pilus assembly protein PilC